MKERARLILTVLLFITLILIAGGIIGYIVNLLLGGKLNHTWISIITFLLIFTLIEILLNFTRRGKYILKKLIGIC